MYCNLGQNQFFDDAGAPLSAGRVKIYAKGSDTLLPIYEDNGDGFVPAQNPVITANDGRIPTIFWPAALVDVVVEKSNGDGTYTELDSYVAGLDLSSIEAVQGVSSIEELRSLMPSENMVVKVNGYYTSGDCPTRKYLWVAGAADTDDGGYVIASGVSQAGRWVMMWDDTEFLPASLYGIMCGYFGYAKTSNMMNFSGLGYYVLVGSVRVEVPPVLLFDWRMAQPISGQSSPIAYHWNGTFETNHYVACARGVVFHTVVQPTIHCAGVRGESFTTAKWMLDRDYTTRDPKERISTLMFASNMHDEFMACAACAKVKYVDIYDTGMTFTVSDKFDTKVVTDYVVTSGNNPDYNWYKGIVICPNSERLYVGQYFRAKWVNAETIVASSSLESLGSIFALYYYSSFKGINVAEKMYFGKGIGFYNSNDEFLINPEDDVNYYPNSPVFKHGLYVTGALNATTLSDSDRKMHINVAPTSLTTVDLTEDSQTLSDTSFYNSKYKINDIIVVSNTGSSSLSVIAVSGVLTVVLNSYESCAFIKTNTNRWNKIAPA